MLPIALLLLNSFTLQESPREILARMGEDSHVVANQGFRVLQFHGHPHKGNQHSGHCDEPFLWVFYFDTAQQRLVSVTNNYEDPKPLVQVVPKKAAVRVVKTPEGYPLLIAEAGSNRVFVAPGATSVSDSVSQVQFMRADDLPRFYPGAK